jgi:Toprim domain
VATDLRTIARALGGEISGGQILCPGPGHSSRDRSLAVRLSPTAPTGYVVHSFAGDDPLRCRDHVTARVGLRRDGRRWSTLRRRKGAAQARHAQSQAPHQGPINGEGTASDASRTESARWLWRGARPIAGSAAERYLREARGYGGPLPVTLRYLQARGDHPHAMIAAFALPNEPEPGAIAIAGGDVTGVHLTRLASDGRGKLGSRRDKIIIGRCLGSPIMLAPTNDLLGLAVCEGIEDALSLHAATGLGAWAAGSASRLAALSNSVPDWIDTVTVCADSDPAGRKGAGALGAALRHRGLHVETREIGSAA